MKEDTASDHEEEALTLLNSYTDCDEEASMASWSKDENAVPREVLARKTPGLQNFSYVLNAILLLLLFWRVLDNGVDLPTRLDSALLNTTLVLDSSLGPCDLLRHTMKYSPECNHTGVGEPRRILITGVGRSGTGHLVKQMRAIGIQVSHDKRGEYSVMDSPDGAISWPHAFDKIGECNSGSWPWRGRSLKSVKSVPHDRRYFRHVLQIVRDPLLTIRSRWNLGDIEVFRELASCKTTSPLDNPTGNSTEDSIRLTLRHWVLWNSFVESYAEYRFRSEDVDADLLHHLYTRAFPLNENHNRTIPSVPIIQETLLPLDGHGTNSDHTKKPKYSFTWDMLYEIDSEFTTLAQLMAVRYGYPLEPDVAQRYPLHRKKQHCGFVTMGKETKWTCSLITI